MNDEHETEAIDKLFLELSQFAKARTAREKRYIALIQELNDLLKKTDQYGTMIHSMVKSAEADFYGE